jgi:thymidylate synthase (FAD)
VVDYMGDDSAVAQAARVSYGKGTKTANEDNGLIRYLMRHEHMTPFEMCEVKFHVKLPIFVARQWIRHRTANVNEMSARYSILDKEFYIPEVENISAQSTNNKQGRSADAMPGIEAREIRDTLEMASEECFHNYHFLLNETEDGETLIPSRSGLARELARNVLPLSTYTQWYWKVDVRNLLGFLRLRSDPHAQFEIRAYAEVMLGIVEKWMPNTYNAFMDLELGSFKLTSGMLDLLQDVIHPTVGIATAAEYGLSKRELGDLLNAIPALKGIIR